MADRPRDPIRTSWWEDLVSIIGIGATLLLAIDHQFASTGGTVGLTMMVVILAFRQHAGTTTLGYWPRWARPWNYVPLMLAGFLTLYFAISPVAATSVMFAIVLGFTAWHVAVVLRRA